MVETGPVQSRGYDNPTCLKNINKNLSFTPAEASAGGDSTKFDIILPYDLMPKTAGEIARLATELMKGDGIPKGPNAPMISAKHEKDSWPKRMSGYTITLPNAIKGESKTTIMINKIQSQATRILLAECDENSHLGLGPIEPKTAKAASSKPAHKPARLAKQSDYQPELLY